MSRNGSAACAASSFFAALFHGPAAFAGTGQPSPWQMNLQGAASPVMESIHSFNTFLLVIITAIVLFVLVLLAVVVLRFNEKANPVPSRTSHNTLIEVAWTVVPVMILVAIAIPSFRLLHLELKVPTADITLKAVGHQWYWSYEYPDHGGFGFDSLLVPENELKPGQPRLLAVDNEVVVPVNKVIRMQVTAADVIHSFAVPSFGIKIDALPGRLNETWFKVTKEGVYYGQCSELCGRDHAFMPIAVRAVSEKDFEAWVASAKGKFASSLDAAGRLAEAR
ncbi:cytochrome c oxidase subunit II [Xanthobacter sp. V4C-4]|uniref:cytochrome c oxidase subunit II n=1 Tax=Xanthobacter cornucopiae TaxID=3119924 RepID=UPI00372B57AE